MAQMAVADEDDKKAETTTRAAQGGRPRPRDERLAAALRENLRRRKAQARDRRRAAGCGESRKD